MFKNIQLTKCIENHEKFCKIKIFKTKKLHHFLDLYELILNSFKFFTIFKFFALNELKFVLIRV